MKYGERDWKTLFLFLPFFLHQIHYLFLFSLLNIFVNFRFLICSASNPYRLLHYADLCNPLKSSSFKIVLTFTIRLHLSLFRVAGTYVRVPSSWPVVLLRGGFFWCSAAMQTFRSTSFLSYWSVINNVIVRDAPKQPMLTKIGKVRPFSSFVSKCLHSSQEPAILVFIPLMCLLTKHTMSARSFDIKAYDCLTGSLLLLLPWKCPLRLAETFQLQSFLSFSCPLSSRKYRRLDSIWFLPLPWAVSI